MIKQCLVCNKEFKTYPCLVKSGRGKYCSVECCLSVTSKYVLQYGGETRFAKGQTPHNKKGFCFIKPRKEGKVYKLILSPNHPKCTKKGYVREHRLVMEESLGRILEDFEVVHHVDGNTLNNKLENLMVLTGAEHRRIHLSDTIHKRHICQK